ncbi:tyrosine-protein phosphatase YwqE [Arcticibacter tournemirensis]|uniref:protein-tyrosine-phosphatase n=1 Tax=Arcticibacter tournemirensis TaxID=699437 RepID=A0A5M9HN22_9SPHI|nr:CpsB/CapC family capsule biosynthesis tyrosine phosphatase [Arcticibacter tournemirensis]KAA8486778.1 histidinol phosphatase [Arcticibacter tournemirensis]TQM49321.1 tyrosine-protein phosphatase YwqE [Arcticibacter tournemirensis]
MFSFFSRKPVTKTLEWMGVDMHSHLVPGIDDGSPDAATSAGYIKSLHELGLEKFICTPHVFMEIYPNSPDSINPALQALRNELKQRKIQVEVSAAAEYMLDPDFDALMKEGNLLCLSGNLVLVEMSYQVETRNIEKYIFDLNIKGYQPVLAHPERYIYYHKNYQQYQKLHERGCLFQLNILSLSGYYGKAVRQIAVNLLNDGLIDLCGTDLHHQRHLNALSAFVQSGSAAKALNNYPLKNKDLLL